MLPAVIFVNANPVMFPTKSNFCIEPLLRFNVTLPDWLPALNTVSLYCFSFTLPAVISLKIFAGVTRSYVITPVLLL